MSKSRRGRGRRSVTKTALGRQKTEQDEQFELMDRVYAFTVDVLQINDSNPSDYKYELMLFKTGDDVILNSLYDNTDDLWLGRIDQIRTTKDRSKTLVKVLWYWSRNDVKRHIISFDPTQCSPYERILSDSYDYVEPHAFQGTTYVHEYDEADLNPPPIGPTSFFLRTKLFFGEPSVKPRIQPPLGADTCLCHDAYNPYPAPVILRSVNGELITSSPREKDLRMHFCPRLGCRRWYHAECLALLHHFDTFHSTTRGIRLLAVDPDSEVPFVTFGHFAEPESRESVADSTEEMTVQDALEYWSPAAPSFVAHLPHTLLAIAQSPIVRAVGAPDGWAIGNVADVVLARRFVYAAIEHQGPPERSKDYLELLERDYARQETLFWLACGRYADVDAGMELDDEKPSVVNGDGGTSASMRGELWDALKAGWAEEVQGTQTATRPDEVDALDGLCADLAKFELLASVYEPYWERRAREFAAAAAFMEGPQFVCPKCGSAI